MPEGLGAACPPLRRPPRLQGWEASGTEASDEFDWTYTTPYGGTAQQQGGGAAAPAAWQPSEQRIDRGMLMARDPILFYDEVELYASDLDDNGAAQLSLKVRVMPKCWYVLLRYWLRVDGVLVRLRETRLFCKLGGGGPPTVLRERTLREETFDQLRARGAPAAVAQYADGEATSQVLLAAGGPTTVLYDQLCGGAS